MDVIVIGAGASGLTCAIALARRGKTVTVFERFANPGKKILVTGNGRCNYWNEDFDDTHFHSDNMQFVSEVNTESNREEVLKFFDSLGIVPTIKNGYYYPMSMQAVSIRTVLLEEAERLGIKIVTGTEVIGVKKSQNGFIVEVDTETHEADAVVVATGSNAYYKENTLGYDICSSFGHNIVETLPSLVQLVGNESYFKTWAGVRCNVSANCLINRNIEKTEVGEIMLTEYGLSGICIFNLSSIATRGLESGDKVEISINFLPEVKNMFAFLEERSQKVDKELGRFFEGIINKKIIDSVLFKANINKDDKWSDLNTQEKENLVNFLSGLRVGIVGTKGFVNAQVSTGGVDTTEIDSQTMESRLCDNLYVIGEVLDVDGECGGYNLGFAWLTALIAGRSVGSD